MVEIRVAVTDAARVHVLLRRLGGLFDRSSLSFDATRNEVQVRSEWGSRSVVEVIDAVQSWLAADEIGSATLSVGPLLHIGRPELRSSEQTSGGRRARPTLNRRNP